MGLEKFFTRHFSLSDQEREKLTKEGKLAETEEKIENANEAALKESGAKMRDELKEELEKMDKAA